MWTNYSRVTISLPDVNVWIALAAEGYPHHMAARGWFAAQPDASVAFCRITQMGIAQAWEIFAQLRADRRLVFAIEPTQFGVNS
jgi:predicted nucleic acid-binding protein